MLLRNGLIKLVSSILDHFAGGHQDHRQDPTGCCQPGENLQGSSDYEDAGPPTHHQAVPGESET